MNEFFHVDQRCSVSDGGEDQGAEEEMRSWGDAERVVLVRFEKPVFPVRAALVSARPLPPTWLSLDPHRTDRTRHVWGRMHDNAAAFADVRRGGRGDCRQQRVSRQQGDPRRLAEACARAAERATGVQLVAL